MRYLRTILLLLLTTAACRAQVYHGVELVRPELLADADGVTPGGTVTIGLHLRTVEGWHTYWQYPGDAGIPTRITWTLPEGYTAGPIQWPIPARTDEPGDIVTYAYHGDVLLLTDIHVPADAKPGTTVNVRAHAEQGRCCDLAARCRGGPSGE